MLERAKEEPRGRAPRMNAPVIGRSSMSLSATAMRGFSLRSVALPARREAVALDVGLVVILGGRRFVRGVGHRQMGLHVGGLVRLDAVHLEGVRLDVRRRFG